ncbi:MAG: hypothetical protein Q8Q89_02660 [bacterium]|nr:hypothetical protein [bacterium]
METVTIPKTEYTKLKRYSSAYLKIASKIVEVEREVFSSPPIRNIGRVTKSFKETNKYSRDFMKSLGKGLKRSSFFR